MTVFNFSQVWGQTTPGNTMKWVYTEPEQNTFTLAEGQTTINLAKATGKKVRCHNLVWYQELPSWITSPTTPWTNATLLAAMENHITNVVNGYGANCYSWDVVNEALDDDGTWRSNVFYDTISAAYVPLASKYASAAVKSAGGNIKLVYNDYNIEFPDVKTTAAVQLVQMIQAYGVEVDGVGFESHFIVGETVSQIHLCELENQMLTSIQPNAAAQVEAMAEFTALGLTVYQTELDVRFTSLPPTSAGLAQQATDYYNTIEACMQTKDCAGMTVWDFDDAYSWIPSTFAGQGHACLLWANLTIKPAYAAVYQAIEGVDCTFC